MADVKISAGADPGTVVATDKVPMARSASTTAYAATMAELATYANGAYVPNYYTGSPSMDGAAASGSLAFVARGDHVHPSDTARVAKAGDTMGGFLTLNANPTANLHAATKQYVDGSAPVGGPYLSVAAMHDVGRNLIHNALFTVAQRGAGPFTTSGYTVDRWLANTTLDTISIARGAASDGDRTAIGDEAATYLLSNSFTGNAGATAFNFLHHRIEDLRRLAGKTVTISFWASCSPANIKLGFNVIQLFGSGGSPSSAVRALVTGNAVTIVGAMARYSTTIAIPSVSGKTLGTNGDHSTALEIWYSSGTTNNAIAGNIGVQSGAVWLWGVQLEIGSVATPLEKRDPVLELQQCQRFYQTGAAGFFGYATAGVGIGYRHSLPVTMRAVPTLTQGGSPVNASLSFTSAVSELNVFLTVTATGAASWQAVYTASADL